MAAHGEAFDLYPNPGEITVYPGAPIFQEFEAEYLKARLMARGSFYNPPLLAYMLSPMTSLGFRDSFWLFSAMSATVLGGFLVMAWRAGRGIPELPLLVLGVVSFKPVYEVIIMGHMTMFFLFALTAGFLLLRVQKP